MVSRLLLFTGQSLDAATFILFFTVLPAWILVGVQPESNPLTGAIFSIGGFVGIVAFKVVAVGLVVWYDGRREGRHWAVAPLMVLGAASGFIGAGFNVANLAAVIAALGGMA